MILNNKLFNGAIFDKKRFNNEVFNSERFPTSIHLPICGSLAEICLYRLSTYNPDVKIDFEIYLMGSSGRFILFSRINTYQDIFEIGLERKIRFF